MSASATGAAEWRKYWPLPFAAAFGYSTSVIHIYGLGPFIEPVQEAFGWTRTQATIGLTLATVINATFAIPIGILVDRIGPRVVGIIGVASATAAFALLSTATGDAMNWYMLWALMALGTLCVQGTVWSSAVASRFESSRGLALAVTLTGASVAVGVYPLLGTWLIGEYGWRGAFRAEAAIWAAITLPMLILFFRGARDVRKKDAPTEAVTVLDGDTIKAALRRPAFYKLFAASLLFTFTIIALVVHFVPILTHYGADRLNAAGIASLIGVFSIIGRLAAGALLDRFRASLIGAAVFVLPIFACLALAFAGANPAAQIFAACIVGLTLGSEVDVVVYLTSRHFGLKNFGALYGGLLIALMAGTAFGPLAAAAVFDATNSYVPFLLLTTVFMAASSVALASLPPPVYAKK